MLLSDSIFLYIALGSVIDSNLCKIQNRYTVIDFRELLNFVYIIIISFEYAKSEVYKMLNIQNWLF